MRTLQTRDIPKYLLAALATGVILLAAPVGASAASPRSAYQVTKRANPPPVARDHRVVPTATVHDHRVVPKVIDHRAQPTVNEHRTGTTTLVRGGTATYTPRKKKVVPLPPYIGGTLGGGPS
jgi:hypothetical protein